MSESEQPARPLLRIIHGGEVSPEELAALVTVVTTVAADSAADDATPSLRRPLSPWVASGLVKGTRTKA